MDLNINNNIKGTWVKYKDFDAEFLLVPFPFSEGYELVDNDLKLAHKKFMYCVKDWKGLTENKKPIKCTNKNKQLLFDYEPVITTWILDKIVELYETE